jgi:hypothetical protein
MPASVGLFVFVPILRRPVTMRGWRGAGCALALGFACACISPSAALAQASSDANGDASKPKTASPKKHVKAAGTQAKSNTATTHSSKSKYASSHRGSKRKTARGQQKIDPERAQAIQEALIREHYLSGAAAGTWNQSCEDAMRRYQADHGWQSKTVPDSRALISLGLGPSHDHLLNPESAMVTGPFAPRSNSSTPDSHSADPGARRLTNPPAAPAPVTAPKHDSSSPQ